MKFRDLRWEPYPYNPEEWEMSQIVVYDCTPMRAFRSADEEQNPQRGYDLCRLHPDDPTKSFGHPRVDNMPLFEFCSAVLPFCRPLPSEVTTSG